MDEECLRQRVSFPSLSQPVQGLGAGQGCYAGGRELLTLINRAVCTDKISDFALPVKCGIWN